MYAQIDCKMVSWNKICGFALGARSGQIGDISSGINGYMMRRRHHVNFDHIVLVEVRLPWIL